MTECKVASTIATLKEGFRLGVGTSPRQNEEYPLGDASIWAYNRVKSPHKIEDERRSMFSQFSTDYMLKLEELDVNAFRFGISWPRVQPVQPSEGELGFDENALETYANWAKDLAVKNISVYITLVHFDIPQWWETKYGGLAMPDEKHKEGIECFKNYVEKVLQKFEKLGVWRLMKERATPPVFITLNEPFLHCLHAYILGRRPPYKYLSFNKFSQSIKNCALLHIAAFDVIHRFFNPRVGVPSDTPSDAPSITPSITPLVGIATNIIVIKSRSKHLSDREKRFQNFYNFSIVDLILKGTALVDIEALAGVPMLFSAFNKQINIDNFGEKMDCFCMNHYNVMKFKLNILPSLDDGPNINNMGWDMVADSLFEALTLVSTYNLPIHITEFGTCGARDKRKGFQAQHLRDSMNCIERALNPQNNIDVCAALWWTLLDNWEWEEHGKTNQDQGEGFGLYNWDGTAKESLVKLFMCMTNKFSTEHTSKSYIF